MMLEVKILTHEEAGKLPEENLLHYWRRDDYNYLVVLINGRVVECRPEWCYPEDQRFDRDLDWIKPLIERAYQQGVKDESQRIQRRINSLRKE